MYSFRIFFNAILCFFIFFFSLPSFAETLFEDDFSSNGINSSKWTISKAIGNGWEKDTGDFVSVSNGVAIIAQNKTDKGGALHSSKIPISMDKTLKLTRRIKINPDSYFRNSNYFVDENDNFIAGYRYFHSYRDEPDGVYFVYQGEEHFNLSWKEWITEVFIFDPQTGEASYSDGNSTMTRTFSSFSGDHVYLIFDAYGWGTGHKIEMDYIRLEQIDSTSSPSTALPGAPLISVNVSGLYASVTWPVVNNATSYQFFYAPYPQADPIYSMDLGNQNSISAALWSGAAYYVAAQSVNAAGNSEYSNIEYFIIDDDSTTTDNANDDTSVTLNFSASEVLTPDEALNYKKQLDTYAAAQRKAIMLLNSYLFADASKISSERQQLLYATIIDAWTEFYVAVKQINVLHEGFQSRYESQSNRQYRDSENPDTTPPPLDIINQSFDDIFMNKDSQYINDFKLAESTIGDVMTGVERLEEQAKLADNEAAKAEFTVNLLTVIKKAGEVSRGALSLYFGYQGIVSAAGIANGLPVYGSIYEAVPLVKTLVVDVAANVANTALNWDSAFNGPMSSWAAKDKETAKIYHPMITLVDTIGLGSDVSTVFSGLTQAKGLMLLNSVLVTGGDIYTSYFVESDSENTARVTASTEDSQKEMSLQEYANTFLLPGEYKFTQEDGSVQYFTVTEDSSLIALALVNEYCQQGIQSYCQLSESLQKVDNNSSSCEDGSGDCLLVPGYTGDVDLSLINEGSIDACYDALYKDTIELEYETQNMISLGQGSSMEGKFTSNEFSSTFTYENPSTGYGDNTESYSLETKVVVDFVNMTADVYAYASSKLETNPSPPQLSEVTEVITTLTGKDIPMTSSDENEITFVVRGESACNYFEAVDKTTGPISSEYKMTGCKSECSSISITLFQSKNDN